MKLQKQLSKLLNVDIETVGWDVAFKEAAIRGNLQTSLPKIVTEICKYLDPFAPDLMKKPESVNEPLRIHNPLPNDFTVQFDVSGSGTPMPFIAKAGEITAFDPAIAIHLKKHLINAILATRNINYPTAEDITKVDNEISVTPSL